MALRGQQNTRKCVPATMVSRAWHARELMTGSVRDWRYAETLTSILLEKLCGRWVRDAAGVMQMRRRGVCLRVTTEDMKTTSPVRTGQKNCECMRQTADAQEPQSTPHIKTMKPFRKMLASNHIMHALFKTQHKTRSSSRPKPAFGRWRL